MAKEDKSFSSRSSRRQKSSFDRFLNWAIGIVVALIVVIGGYLLINILNSPSDTASTQNATTKSEEKHKTAGENSSKDKSDKDNTQATDDQNQGDDSQVSDDDSTTSDDSDSTTDEDAKNGPALTGPWKPIGTSQSEPHTTNYDQGSVDWNERVKAMSIATGISEGDMVVVWLGNGGAPDKSLGKVHAKGSNTTYDVLLQWVKNKGWKPLSVDEEGS
ncbi:putative membrane protein YrrS [Pullulanibacillus camelliae]|uniref:Putative membrane protein YrrS n=2 Tax=Pullulanibacillus camelliae TaxID=1707096 RepID=A0A8J3DUD6_9BACL|nr:putative membrane protein YrrS [Pullulanibacillus camelliae]